MPEHKTLPPLPQTPSPKKPSRRNRYGTGYTRMPSISKISEEQDITSQQPISSQPFISGRISCIPDGHGLGLDDVYRERSLSPPGERRRVQDSPSGMTPSTAQSSTQIGSDGSPRLLRKSTPGPYEMYSPPSASTGSGPASMKGGFDPASQCSAHGSIEVPATHWVFVVIMTLSTFSTVFSGLFLVIALNGPKYGNIIRPGGLSIGTATILYALFAKLVELSFVTVFVAFVGQVLSRRALSKRSTKGVTLAEFSMRSWVMQPGTILTNPQAARASILTFLGLCSVLVAACAVLYTTAAETLVSPSLSFSDFEHVQLQGLVKSIWSNIEYMTGICATPISVDVDPMYSGSACLQIESASQGFHNYQQFISDWTNVALNGNGSTDLSSRPNGFGMVFENTTIRSAWTDILNMTEASEAAGRVLNNVSLAMPHLGVLQAARDNINGIIQPYGTEGQGIYDIKASVPSPVVNVLCASMTEDDLRPMVYSLWDSSPSTLTMTDLEAWPSQAPMYEEGNYFNATSVDDIFGFGPKYGRLAPFFPILPAEYNTIMNDTGLYEPRDSVYLLGNGGPTASPPWILCALKASLTPFCSTWYNATATGASMSAKCDDLSDPYTYINSADDASRGNASVSKDWPSIAFTWGRALSLNDGLFTANASIARLLTQLIPPTTSLTRGLPTIAEALAVMAGSTLLGAIQDTPFVEYWNYSTTILSPGQYQTFNATIRSQQYSSGGSSRAEQALYVILVAVFAGNVGCFLWFILARGLVTDFSEPQNIFALAINSPPSEHFAGSCGSGPNSWQYRAKWYLNKDETDHVYLTSKSADANDLENQKTGDPKTSTNTTTPTRVLDRRSAITRSFSRLSKRKTWI